MHIAMPALTADFFSGLLSIIFVNIVLSGDNAVLIAMAVRNLPKRQRALGIGIGAGVAVILRIILTFFAAQLLEFNYVKLVGGLLIAWIGVKLFMEGSPDDASRKECATLRQAISTILVADLVMSLDNVLAVAGASKGDLFLLIFGLAMSIPIVIFASDLLSKLMDRYPIIIYAGAAILGKVAAEMIFTDPFVTDLMHPGKVFLISSEILGAVGVIVTGKVALKFMPAPNGNKS